MRAEAASTVKYFSAVPEWRASADKSQLKVPVRGGFVKLSDLVTVVVLPPHWGKSTPGVSGMLNHVDGESEVPSLITVVDVVKTAAKYRGRTVRVVSFGSPFERPENMVIYSSFVPTSYLYGLRYVGRYCPGRREVLAAEVRWSIERNISLRAYMRDGKCSGLGTHEQAKEIRAVACLPPTSVIIQVSV
eukprot:12619-Amphidinium_carterae.1